MKLNREKFLHSLEMLRSGLAPREIIEQSSCIVFQNGLAWTFNDEICCRVPSGLDKSVTAAVKADKLLELLSKLVEEEIDVDVTDSELKIIGKGRRASFHIEKEIGLPIDSVEKPKEWKALPGEFLEAMDVVRQCASKDSSQFYRTCVNIHPKWLEACDAFQYCKWEMPTGVKEKLMVRQASVKQLTMLGVSEFCEGDSWIHFRNDRKLILSCRKFSEDFPDLSEAISKTGTPTVFPKGLSEAADKALVFSMENSDSNLVHVDLKPGKLRIVGLGISGSYSEVKKIKYSGKALSFMISPVILADMVKKNGECKVSENQLVVNGGSYKYAAWLFKPKTDNDESEENETQEESEE